MRDVLDLAKWMILACSQYEIGTVACEFVVVERSYFDDG